MLSKRTIIGLIVGSAIIAIGGVSLLLHIGIITINENYIVEVGGSTIGIITINENHIVEAGDSTFYTIPAPAHTQQSLKIIGDSFDLKLQSPADGLQIPKTSYKKELKLDWVHLEDGETKIQIQNTGNKELEITGVLIRSSDPIWFTFDIMVIITGLVIIGLSLGFSIRKPRGF